MIEVERPEPDFCFSINNEHENKVVVVKRGELGYFPTTWTGRAIATQLNEQLGVTWEQELKMVVRSMFGW